ncbi:phospholipase [Campylobacter coli]|nr:phospholipase [Campylobacter coli]EAH6986099.1 phospholipase [Campylobacter coli]EGJ9507355.1 phospholipase [Campylobacter coli]EGN9668399.1 phospholipase [Campylobacter coli]
MRKIALFLSLCVFIWASDLQQALEYEKQGDYKKAMEIYKKLALKNSSVLISQEQNNSSEATQMQNSITMKKEEKQDFSRLALANYLGENESFNPLGISSYKMNYFLPFAYSFDSLGGENRKTEMKFQLSIKKRLFEDLLGLGEKYYVGYTQTSWWQNYKHSSPFRETNYQPEFFVDIPLHFEDYKFLNNLRVGILHESNGKGDENLESRSWNRVYASSVFLYQRFLFVPRIWYRIPENSEDDDNPEITHYMGNFDINMGYLGNDYFINLMLRNNLDFHDNKGAVQVDIGYDIFDNGIYWYLQYFNGYGESLIDYNKRLQRLSTGFLISY